MGVAKVGESNANLNAVGDQHDDGNAGAEAVDVEPGQEETRRPRIVRRPLAPTKEI